MTYNPSDAQVPAVIGVACKSFGKAGATGVLMGSTVEDGAAFGAEEVRPAGGFSAFVGDGLTSGASPGWVALVIFWCALGVGVGEGQEVDRESNRPER